MNASIKRHASSCCKKHGCKSVTELCPVTNGFVEQTKPCTRCGEESLRFSSRESFQSISKFVDLVTMYITEKLNRTKFTVKSLESGDTSETFKVEIYGDVKPTIIPFSVLNAFYSSQYHRL